MIKKILGYLLGICIVTGCTYYMMVVWVEFIATY